jgi:curved DNA-binding protein
MDHYSTLGVSKTATPDEIKKAYRKQASQHHPDKGGDTAKFQTIEEAYRVLSDAEKRQQYDNPMPQGFHTQGGMPPGFENIFSQMFGGGNPFDPFNQRRQQPQQQVFRTSINITLEQAYTGSSQTLRLQTPTGINHVNIEIPKGIKNSDQVRYDNVLDTGTLMVEFRLLPNLKFDRRINDLYCNHTVSVLDLIVGTDFEFTTLSGKTLLVTIRPKTQPHMQLKIVGEGMPVYGAPNTYGDQIILLNPIIPDTIDEEITQSILRSKTK